MAEIKVEKSVLVELVEKVGTEELGRGCGKERGMRGRCWIVTWRWL